MQEKAYRMELFSILDADGIDGSTIGLMDGGIEQRYHENYYYDNNRRLGYGGYLFQYTLDGTGIYEKSGMLHEIKKGMGFFVKFPEDSKYYLPKDSDKPWTLIFLHFTGESLEPFADRLKCTSDGVFQLDPSSKSIRMLFQLHKRMSNGEKLKKYEGSEFLFSFLCTLLREVEETDFKQDSSIVKRSLEIMEQNHKTLESIQLLAEQLGVSHEHFCRLFKQKMHVTPGQYLTSLRLQSAMYDLLNTNDSLEHIAQRNGFSNANYFGKVFKKRVGTTPIQYRNME